MNGLWEWLTPDQREQMLDCVLYEMERYGVARPEMTQDKVDEIVGRAPTCDHDWVDACNEAIESGEWCSKCNAVRAGNTPGPHDWRSCSDELPPGGFEVEAKVQHQGAQHETILQWVDGFWYLPDGTMYVYDEPTHWRLCGSTETKP